MLTTLTKGYNTSYSSYNRAKFILQVSLMFPGCYTGTHSLFQINTICSHGTHDPALLNTVYHHDSFALPENMGIIQITNNHVEVNSNLTPSNLNSNNNSRKCIDPLHALSHLILTRDLLSPLYNEETNAQRV